MRPGNIFATFDHGTDDESYDHDDEPLYFSTRSWSFDSSCSVHSLGFCTSGERCMSHLRAYARRKGETRRAAGTSAAVATGEELRQASRGRGSPFSALLAGPVNVEGLGDRGPLLWPLVLHNLYQALVLLLPPLPIVSAGCILLVDDVR